MANRIIKRTNPYSFQSAMLTHDEAMLHDQVKQAEAMGEYDKMQKCLDNTLIEFRLELLSYSTLPQHLLALNKYF